MNKAYKILYFYAEMVIKTFNELFLGKYECFKAQLQDMKYDPNVCLLL